MGRRRERRDDGRDRARPAPVVPVVPDAADLAASSASDLPAVDGGAPGVAATEFFTIEVANRTGDELANDPLAAAYSARGWKDSYGEALIEAAITHGVKEWNWAFTSWGVVLELGFADEVDWLRFRATPGVKAALDAVPDPVSGLYVYPGRGGTSGARVATRPRPRPLAGGAVPEPPLAVLVRRPLGQQSTQPAPTRPAPTEGLGAQPA